MSWLPLLALDATNYVLVLLLVAMGLVVVFGLMNVINMAHGELFLLGAYTVLLVQRQGGGFWLGLVLAPLAVGLLGALLHALVIRHIQHRFQDTILATWGLSLAIKQAVVLGFGPASQQVSPPFAVTLDLFGQPYPAYRLFIMAVSLLVVLLAFLLLFATRIGLAARATMQDRETATCLGIDTARLDRWTFATGAGLAGLAGAVMAPVMSVDPQMGLGFLVPAFLAILVGGTGHLAGPILGALVVGGTDSVVARLWSPVVAQIAVFTLAVLVIRLFPTGLLGPREGR
jgi:urea transport system permease protein